MTASIPTSEFVTDTMGLVLHVERRKLVPTVKSIFDAVEGGTTTIYIPTLVFAEILYLSEKKRIGLSLERLKNHLQKYPNYKEYPMNFSVIQSAGEITDIPELHDRLIAGTARLLGLTLITNDPVIQVSTFVRTVW